MGLGPFLITSIVLLITCIFRSINGITWLIDKINRLVKGPIDNLVGQLAARRRQVALPRRLPIG